MISAKNTLFIFFTLLILNANSQKSKLNKRAIWTNQQANTWYKNQPWLVGCNYITSSAINQLEMWQAETFDTSAISRELGWASSIGMNTIRVFLHDLLYKQDPLGFLKRIDIFLAISARNKIKVMFVLFDSVWDPYPMIGKQREPKPFVHNSGWVQSPGAVVLNDSTQYKSLEEYVNGVISYYANDTRILAWDIWNEPDNMNQGSYGKYEPKNKGELVTVLLKKAFNWARNACPSQPLTSGIWMGDWNNPNKMKAWENIQIQHSDIISFHNYDGPEELLKRIKQLQRYGKPIFNTEFMSRGNGSYFEKSLPIFKKFKIAAFNWGLVAGKTNTIYPWDSWDKKYTKEPELWFHDIFRQDGSPFKKSEVEYIKMVTSNKIKK